MHSARTASASTVRGWLRYGRVLAPGLATLDPQLPAELSTRSELATAWRHLDRSLDQFINNGLAAA